jgi:hypothetical protein
MPAARQVAQGSSVVLRRNERIPIVAIPIPNTETGIQKKRGIRVGYARAQEWKPETVCCKALFGPAS